LTIRLSFDIIHLMKSSAEISDLRPQLQHLRDYGQGIDWKSSPKGFLPFVRELNVRESTLRYISAEESLKKGIPEGLLREVGAVDVYIYHDLPDGRKLQLVETEQVFNTGQTRRRNYSWISEKVEGHEQTLLAASRGVNEELFNTEDDNKLELGRLIYAGNKFILEDSTTYPGLRSGKTIYDYDLFLTDEEYKSHQVTLPSEETVYGFREEQRDRPDGKTTYFTWREIPREPTPTFDEWIRDTGISLPDESPYNIESFYRAVVEENELRLIRENGELKRYGKVATVDVFYQTEDGKRYKLREVRYRLNQGRNHKEVLAELLKGDVRGVTPSPKRRAPNSISERIKLNGEVPEDATIRALHEELFNGVLEDLDASAYSDLDNVLRENLKFGTPKRTEKAANESNNSYQGVASIYDNYPSTITFTPDMHVPIQIVNGIPQTLFEFAEGKYLNLYIWEEVKDVAESL